MAKQKQVSREKAIEFIKTTYEHPDEAYDEMEKKCMNQITIPGVRTMGDLRTLVNDCFKKTKVGYEKS